MAKRDEEIIRNKLQFYKDKDFSVHLVLKAKLFSSEYTFRNGKTVKFNDDSIEFNDEKLGIILIYLSEIWNVEKREEKR